MILRIGHVDGAMTIRHGMRRITYVTVGGVSGIGLRSIERKFSILAEIEVLGLCLAWRPGIEMNPVVAPSLEQKRFLERQRTFVFEPVFKPGNFDLLAEVNRRVAAKRNRAKGLA